MKSNSDQALPLYWTNIIFFSVTTLLALIAVPWYFLIHGVHFGLLAMALIYYIFVGLSITGGYHRLFSHRAYEASPVMRAFYLLFGAAAFEGSCLKWSYDHRRHHREVDTDLDPYNINKGFWWAHMGWLMRADSNGFREPKLADLEKDWMVRFQHKYFVPLSFFMCFALPTLLSWWFFNRPLGGFLVAGVFRMFLLHHATFFINSLSHMWGKRPYSIKHTARDNCITALVTFGEGYHNYHHEFPSDYRNGVRWWQFDPTKWLIRMCSFLGLTWNLKRISKEKILMARVELGQKLYPRPAMYQKIINMKENVDSMHKRFVELKKQYHEARKNFSDRSNEQLDLMRREFEKTKNEFRLMRVEFRRACQQWIAQTQQQMTLGLN